MLTCSANPTKSWQNYKKQKQKQKTDNERWYVSPAGVIIWRLIALLLLTWKTKLYDWSNNIPFYLYIHVNWIVFQINSTVLLTLVTKIFLKSNGTCTFRNPYPHFADLILLSIIFIQETVIWGIITGQTKLMIWWFG